MRFEWGESGVRAVAAGAACLVVVDVLSFSTAVEIATSRGATIYPARGNDESASLLAAAVGARLAVGRGETTPEDPYSLSPASLADVPSGERIVLPSPNGAAVALAAASSGDAVVLCGCLRNATAVARTAAGLGGPVAVIAAGERWPDGSLRVATEDLVGSGAILGALEDLGVAAPSPEALAATAAFDRLSGDLGRALLATSSGRELAETGYLDDVVTAAAVDASASVPRLSGRAFVA